MRNNSVKLFEFGPVVQEISFKDFKSRAIHTILVEGFMWSIPVKLFKIWTSGSGVDII